MMRNTLKWFGSCSLFLLIVALTDKSLAQQINTVFTWDGKGNFTEGSAIGPYWCCLWLGYGTGRVEGGQLWLSPGTSTSPLETHSALVRSNFALGRAWDISVSVTTDAQLRTAKNRRKFAPSPNPWETAWLIGNMTDYGDAGIYFIYKPNGVELGAYGNFGGIRTYLYTSKNPTMTVGKTYLYRLTSDGNTLTASIGNNVVAQASLASLAGYQFGNKIGLYTEDAAVHFGPVSVATSYP